MKYIGYIYYIYIYNIYIYYIYIYIYIIYNIAWKWREYQNGIFNCWENDDQQWDFGVPEIKEKPISEAQLCH